MKEVERLNERLTEVEARIAVLKEITSLKSKGTYSEFNFTLEDDEKEIIDQHLAIILKNKREAILERIENL